MADQLAVQASSATNFPATSTQQGPLSSLYVGDLHPNVTEAMLYNKFAAVGPVLSIRVCRDAITRRSLGYAYVNFQQPADAARAIDTMNFDLMNNKPIRIMWSQRDPTVRRSNTGNIFIKNLDPQIDTKSIYDTFSMFGTILSCKVACDDEGKSKGYGFVHFDNEESALKAIEKVDQMLLDKKIVSVCKFQPRSVRLREMGDAAHRFTNVYVKNFGNHLDDASLTDFFERFGKINSAVVMKDDEGKSRGFGFVCFDKHEDAAKAVEEMDNTTFPGTDLKLTVCRAQKKSERQAELARIYEAYKLERQKLYQGTNLYVKNLDDTIDTDELRRSFEPFGKITSAKVMVDENGASKGFGFVCYGNVDDATKALGEMNSKMLKNKPLYVAVAQRKEERRAQLAQQYMQRVAAMRVSQNQAGNMPRYNAGIGNIGFGGMPGYAPPQAYSNIGRPPMMNGFPPMQQNQFPGQYGLRPQNVRQPMLAGGNTGFVHNPGKPNRQRRFSGPFNKSNSQHFERVQSQYHGAFTPNDEFANKLEMANNSPQETKQVIGEKLYGLISSISNDENVGKITGMLLEMDNKDLVTLLTDENLLKERVKEAGYVLKRSAARG